MKLFLAVILTMCFSALAGEQPVSVRVTNGVARNLTLAGAVTNSAVGNTKIIGTGAQGREVGAALVGLTWDGTTLVGDGAGALTNNDTRGISFKGQGMFLGAVGAGNSTFVFTNSLRTRFSTIEDTATGLEISVAGLSGSTSNFVFNTNLLTVPAIAGNGAGLTDIGTNSMSASAHTFYSTDSGGITALEATNISSFIVGRRGADNVHVNVLDYGATPYIHTDNTVPVPLTIPDQHIYITNAIAAASLGGISNVVHFPEGIYRSSLKIYLPRNVTLQGVGIMFGNGVTSGYNLVTNNYSMIWRYPLGDGISFYDVSPGNGNGIRNISIHGHTNPVSASALVSSSSSTFGGIGLQIYDEDSFWCQRFTGDNFAVCGFKVGLWAEVNNARFDFAMLQGNDVAYLSTHTNYFTELRDAGLDWFNTNILILSSNRNGTRRTEFARGEQNTLVLPSGGGRAGSLCYFLAGTRSLAIEGASDFQFAQYAWLIDSLMTVDGMAAEMDTMSGTNFVRAFGSQVTFNLSSAYINGNPALPTWCLVNNLAQSFYGSIDGMILGSVPTHLDSGEALLLLSPKQSHAFLRNINGSGVMAMTDDPTYWARIDNSTRYHEFYFQHRNPVYGGADTFSTNFVGQVGRIAIYKAPPAYLEPEYLGGALQTGTNPAFTRLINSDFQTAQEVANAGGKIGTNITVGNFRATGQALAQTFVGNGASVTNIGTNSLSAAAHALYIAGGGGTQNLSQVLAVGNDAGDQDILNARSIRGTDIAVDNDVMTGGIGEDPEDTAALLFGSSGNINIYPGFDSGLPSEFNIGRSGSAGPPYYFTVDTNGITIVRSNLVVTGGSAGLPGLTVGGTALVVTNGNVGIGETAPASKLSVSGNVSVGAGYDTTAAPANGAIFEGNVGIGTASPNAASKLHVEGQSRFIGNILAYAADNNTPLAAGIHFLDGYSGIRQDTSQSLNFDVYNGGASISALKILQNGNVGIGTTTPVGKLDVNGQAGVASLLVTNTAVIGGNVTINGNTALSSLFMSTAGSTFSITSGVNGRAGVTNLTGGTVTVGNTTVTANTLVFPSRKAAGGTIGMAITWSVSAGTSFTINTDNALDTSTFAYFLIENP